MPTTSTIDLSKLPAPPVVEVIDYEQILAANMAEAQELLGDDYDLTDEADPAVAVIQAFSYREANVLRPRVNDAAKAVMIAYAGEGDLENLGALMDVARQVVTPADPDTGADAVMEDIEKYRQRILLAPQGFSVAGPAGAYLFHALSASSDVLDVSVDAPDPDDIQTAVITLLQDHGVDASVITAMQAMLDAANWPGTVIVSVLSRTGDGTAPQTTLDAVNATLNSEDVRPLTDFVKVQSAQMVPYAIDATLTFYAGPDRSVVMAAARAALDAYVAESRLLDRDITRAGIIAALKQANVQDVDLRSPPTNVAVNVFQAGNCTGINLVDGGVAE